MNASETEIRKKRLLSYSIDLTVPSLNDINDDILVEIFKLLPLDSLYWCQRVCKHWLSLILKNILVKSHDALVYHGCDGKLRILDFGSASSPLKLHELSLDFLPIRFIKPFDFVGSSDGLVCIRPISTSFYYVCNPITKLYLEIPSPKLPQNFHRIRDPFYGSGKHAGFICNNHGFKLVLFQEYSSYSQAILRVCTFCSQTRQWTEFCKEFPPLELGQYTSNCKMSLCNGKLHGLCSNNNIIVYDPAKENIIFIRLPYAEEIKRVFMKENEGKLRLYMFSKSHDVVLQVWELDNYESKKWSSKNKIEFDERTIPNLPRALYRSFHVRAFIKINEDTVYVCSTDNVILCNLKSKTIKVILNVMNEDVIFDGLPFVFYRSPLALKIEEQTNSS